MKRAEVEGSRILITGATGMFARPLVQALAKHAEVFAAARYRKQADHDDIAGLGAHPVRIDLSDPASLFAIPAVDYVVNAAVAKSGDWTSDLRENAEGVGHLIAHCRSAKAFLHISTTGVYAFEGGKARAETDPLGDNHRSMMPTYSIAKIATESVARFAATSFGVPLVIARLSVPYGDMGGWPVMHLMQMKHGQAISVHPQAPNAYNPLHVDDYVDKIPWLLGAAGGAPVTVNFGGSQAVSIEEWSAYLGELTGLTPTFREDTSAFGGLPIDTTRMHELIGETKVDWRDGMARMVRAVAPDMLIAEPEQAR
ncbi:NAD-dependent epimerase/dehydratase family protein [Sphingomonas jatrophae]|uniref:Nucleoside-diphosphate-sugar epimerase n=1 Tax=Sphingomonas jatrophae TaxID=1166337 RepID=A0A1I6K8K7_9SPHN|nr:NAD(P)-dependent oxidoreductase [Sphingomonas jatrophae]SFR87571.1 Nucleoside-diphosphate-sugar epimerase [Sphingomonas jatrophae]